MPTPLSSPAAAPAPEQAFSHPVLDAAALGPERPVGVQLLGQAWVVWRGPAGEPLAAPDRCPHRGARLSLGQVVQGVLACPYHGWRFGPDGRCEAVPAVPAWVPPASHGLCGLRRLHEAHGLLWLRPDGAQARLPRFDAEADTRLRKLNVGPYEVATSAPRIVENFLDLAHFGTVHAGWLGDAQHLEVPAYTVTMDPAEGVVARGCQAWQPQSNRLSTEGSWVDYEYRVPAPYAAVLLKAPHAQAGYRESIALFIQPEAPTRCRVWFRLAVPDWASSEAELCAFQDTIFRQDQPVLESQQPALLPVGGTDDPSTPAWPAEVHCAADRSAMAYRRYLQALGVRFGTC